VRVSSTLYGMGCWGVRVRVLTDTSLALALVLIFSAQGQLELCKGSLQCYCHFGALRNSAAPEFRGVHISSIWWEWVVLGLSGSQGEGFD
jgi:hypothetical protein